VRSIKGPDWTISPEQSAPDRKVIVEAIEGDAPILNLNQEP
jgi:hypothetical protein